MAAARDFWLPSEFLTDDILAFNTDFPPYFGSCGSPVESVVGSTETESDEEDWVAGLARRLEGSILEGKSVRKITVGLQNLEKPRVLSVSPQSTLSPFGGWSGNGSPNGPSPTATPVGADGDAWDLIFEAAGQVARLKVNGSEGILRNRGFLGPPQIHSPLPRPAQDSVAGFFPGQCPSRRFSHNNPFGHGRGEQLLNQPALFAHQSQLQRQLTSLKGGGRVQVGWPPAVQVQRRIRPTPPLQLGGSGVRPVVHAGFAEKKKCAGTGVFLPRRYNPSENRVRPAAAIPPPKVVQAPNKNSGEIPIRALSPAPPCISVPHYDIMAAQRSMVAAAAGARQSLRAEGAVVNHDLCLPQDWTY